MAFTQITRGQLRTRVLERLGIGGGVWWRVDEINRNIQRALRTWNALTGYWKTRVSIGPTVAGKVWYSVPGTVITGFRLLFNGIPLGPSSIQALNMGRSSWESDTTTTGGEVPTQPQIWAPAGLTLMAIWPADAVGGNSLNADGIADTPILTVDGDFVNIDTSELDCLLDYIEHLCQFKSGAEVLQNSQALLQDFLKAASVRNQMLSSSNLFKKWMGLQMDEESDPRRREEMTSSR